MLRAVCLSPTRLAARDLARLGALQPCFNRLYDAVARDVGFVVGALSVLASSCAWNATELAAFERLAASQPKKPRLLLPNSVFLEAGGGALPDASAAESKFVLTVGNVQAGEPYQLQLVHTLQSAGRTGVLPGPLRTVSRAIATTARLVHADGTPCVAILTKPAESLALRTAVDVRGVGRELQEEHGVDVRYVSPRELADASVDSTGELWLPSAAGGRRVSVVYSRYDWSHPSGAYSAAMSEHSAELQQEWATVERIERSRAVMSSSLGCRLAHRRAVQHALSRPQQLERFLPADEAAAIRAVLPEQWCLAHEGERRVAARLVEEDADGFVAKNVLRPRTGSGATQDRDASGGRIIRDAAELRALLSDERRAVRYMLYRKIRPRTHHAEVVVHASEVHELQGSAVSEVASFGAFVADETGRVIMNELAGFGARTRPSESDHPLAKSLGYGALTCVAESLEHCKSSPASAT
ncbi:hypothetical protein AB1Y20_018727 [Prymnesium parvum]|uniref:Glutathione synthase n=1 Tax=Prymnesium parvum TaxID=97485 RepID=A0AB34JQM0_PRYPA